MRTSTGSRCWPTVRPAAALYENLHYGDAGLCRSPLDAAMRAELLASQAIAAARTRPAPDEPPRDATH